jgi:HrpA-like RNA helicase
MQLRALGIENEESFPFPSAPPRESITRAFNILVSLGAIKPKNTRAKGWQAAIQSMNEKLSGNVEDKNSRGCVTALGKKIAKFPIK